MGNKLFTTTINKQLFNQYKFGGDLSKQKVVAKIFNPYGEGRWFLLNSDPEDPDYLWAIVSMHGNVEIGSVSRRDLESIRLTPFRLPLERDIYFSPKNAEEVYQGLMGGKFYAKGGKIHSSDDMYSLNVYDENNTLVTTRRFRAKHMKEAQEIVEYEYEDDIKTKYGDDLRFRIVLANPDDQISEPNLMKRGGELKKKFDEGGKVGESTEAPNPAYLMTLDEYLSSPIVPLMKEYDKFLKKNIDYLQSPEYYGYYYMPIEEAIELGEKTRFGTGERYGKTPEAHIRYNWSSAWERNTGNHNKLDYNEQQVFRKGETTPLSIVNDNNNFRDSFLQYYSLKDLTRIEKDEKKSNKRAIKRALDNDIYTKLYGSGKISLQRLKEITDSVGIKIPKRVLEANLEEKVDEDIKKSLSKLPKRSLDKLIELSNQLKEDLKPLQEEIFEREYKRYEEILPRYIGKTLTASEIGGVVPFYINVYNVKNETKYETSPRTGYRTYITYSTILGLRDNYKVFLTEHLNQYVEALAYKIIFTIMDNFKNITLPIKSVERIYIQVGYKGFEGAYKFTFENGSSFILKTQGIGAGGYNIQVYHFRYLSNIEAITLPDGTRTRDLSSFRG
jgi:hypothetical protein